MSKMKVLGICLIALLAVGAVSASGASAKPSLFVTSKGAAVGNGAPSGVYVQVNPESGGSGCFIQGWGALTVNGKPKDKAAFTESNKKATTNPEEVNREGCSPETSLTGVVSGVELKSTGHITVKAKLKYQRGPCVYEISKIAGSFKIPGSVNSDIKGVIGKKIAPSNSGCATTASFTVTPYLDSLKRNFIGWYEFYEVYEAEDR